ncbi:SigE family RNA polymerase sigma factor [Parasphingorhabdus pacifica]
MKEETARPVPQDELDSFARVLKRSSIGTDSTRALRHRTPPDKAEDAVQRAAELQSTSLNQAPKPGTPADRGNTEHSTKNASPVTAGLGDRLAASTLTDLYQEHYNQLLRIAVLLVDDRASAEDIMQDAYIRVFESRSQLRDLDKALAFLRQAVLNQARSMLRHRTITKKYQPKLATQDSQPDDTRRGIDRAILADALAQLSRRQREALVLRYYADLSESHTAELMGYSSGAVRAFCSQGVSRLSSLLGAGAKEHTTQEVNLLRMQLHQLVAAS